MLFFEGVEKDTELRRFRVLIDATLGKFGQCPVGFLLFGQRLLQELYRLVEAGHVNADNGIRYIASVPVCRACPAERLVAVAQTSMRCNSPLVYRT